jgi:hypothetical protein
MVVEGKGIGLSGDKVSIEFMMSSFKEARDIFDRMDIESEEWQNIFDSILKAFGTKMKEEDDEDEAKQ